MYVNWIGHRGYSASFASASLFSSTKIEPLFPRPRRTRSVRYVVSSHGPSVSPLLRKGRTALINEKRTPKLSKRMAPESVSRKNSSASKFTYARLPLASSGRGAKLPATRIMALCPKGSGRYNSLAIRLRPTSICCIGFRFPEASTTIPEALTAFAMPESASSSSSSTVAAMVPSSVHRPSMSVAPCSESSRSSAAGAASSRTLKASRMGRFLLPLASSRKRASSAAVGLSRAASCCRSMELAGVRTGACTGAQTLCTTCDDG
mmetsp:Transcript_84652/g.154943  ORF Transcript_84652/g.154943 Transcript_84652/m.154943 type:complete len:263 (-) Transcript_84652:116-904(-)